MIRLKSHQSNILFVIVGVIIGGAFSYWMLAQSVSMKIDNAYEIGFTFGRSIQQEESLQKYKDTHIQLDTVSLCRQIIINPDSLK